MKILISGDFCPKDRVAELIEHQEYSQIFAQVVNYTENSDYSIVNLECPIFNGEFIPINKCGPCLKASSKTIGALKYAGFDCVTLANNHFRDYGNHGVNETIKHLQENCIDFVGGGNSIAESQQILYKTVDGKTVAFVNFCENEFSIATMDRGGSAPLDIVDNTRQIIEARNNADYVIVIVHGGHEYFQYPSPRMKKQYHFFIDMGVDVVVNHHQHCYSGYEIYNGKPIFYGLGNFCFDWDGKRGSIWNEGYFVILDIKDATVDFEIIPYTQCDTSPNVEILGNEAKQSFEQSVAMMNMIISSDNRLKTIYDSYINSRKRQVMGLFSSYHNRYLNAAARRGWLPNLITKSEVASILNYINCEAHRDIVISVLENELNKS